MERENQIVERVLKLLIDHANCTKPENFDPENSEHVVCLLVIYTRTHLKILLQKEPDDIRADIRELVGHVFCILHPAPISDNDQWKYEPIEIQPFDTALKELERRCDIRKNYHPFVV